MYHIHVYEICLNDRWDRDSVDVEPASTLEGARANLLAEFDRTVEDSSKEENNVKYLVAKAMIAQAEVGQEIAWRIRDNNNGAYSDAVYTHSIRLTAMGERSDDA